MEKTSARRNFTGSNKNRLLTENTEQSFQKLLKIDLRLRHIPLFKVSPYLKVLFLALTLTYQRGIFQTKSAAFFREHAVLSQSHTRKKTRSPFLHPIHIFFTQRTHYDVSYPCLDIALKIIFPSRKKQCHCLEKYDSNKQTNRT